MNKTIHQKLANKYPYTHAADMQLIGFEDVFSAFRQEKEMIKEAAKDLLSPRPEAIARLLEMSRSL